METNDDMLQSDFFETQWESNKDSARDAFIDEVSQILMPIEHLVSQHDQVVYIDDVPVVATALSQASNLRFFSYKTDIEGKYQVYEETFEYDFSIELKDILRDKLGYNGKYFLTLLGEKI